jgi:hypothetical protein
MYRHGYSWRSAAGAAIGMCAGPIRWRCSCAFTRSRQGTLTWRILYEQVLNFAEQYEPHTVASTVDALALTYSAMYSFARQLLQVPLYHQLQPTAICGERKSALYACW